MRPILVLTEANAFFTTRAKRPSLCYFQASALCSLSFQAIAFSFLCQQPFTVDSS